MVRLFNNTLYQQHFIKGVEFCLTIKSLLESNGLSQESVYFKFCILFSNHASLTNKAKSLVNFQGAYQRVDKTQ